MRFADADVMAEAEGSAIPPLEVRLDLRPGDCVGLYEEVRHPSMGAGYAPLEVVVLGSPTPGWFIGATEDGQEVEFHAGNVADVLHGSPSMGGLFDWVKKLIPPSPGEMIQRPPVPPPMLPAPAPAPGERRGIIAQVKSFFAPLIPGRAESETPARSIFDVFKKPSVPAGLPSQRASSEVAPIEERPSVISVFKPGQKTVIPIIEQITAPAVYLAPGEKKIIPFVEALTAPATVFPESPAPEPFEVRELRQKELWTRIIEEAAPEATSIEKVVQVFAPEEIRPKAEVIPPDLPRTLHRKIKVLPLPRRAELLPSVDDLARGFATLYNPIGELWDVFRQARQSREWQENISKYGVAKEEFETLGTCGGQPTIYEEISSFFNIPWEELRNRAVIREDGDYEEWVGTDRIWMDIIAPLVDRTTQAFNLMKPEDLPGEVVWERSDPHGPHTEPCVITLGYTEGELIEEPEPLRYGGPSTEIEEEAEETQEAEEPATVEDYEREMGKIEREAAFFLRERENLNQNDPEYRQKLAFIENELEARRTALQLLNQELSELQEPPAKRAPSGKKKSKRGKKGK